MKVILRVLLVGASLTAFLFVSSWHSAAQAAQPAPDRAKLISDASSESQACIDCHSKKATPLVVDQWLQSRHAGTGVACYECHQSDKSSSESFEHYGKTISALVSPKRCGTCHVEETAQFESSHHAAAGEILGSVDNILGEVVEGPPAAVSGCQKCHGSKVKVTAGGKFDPTTWPNEGIGRLNPDGSKGSCSVCHSRHTFAVSIARRPESCGYCHLGPDHPQAEIYAESKHGVTHAALVNQMNLDSRTWVLGKDYNAAPNCATCHMGATTKLPNTHDVGTRLSWNLRPEVAIRMSNWQQKRGEMQQVCSNCHASEWVGNFYLQFDNVVDLGNTKFFQPSKDVMAKLAAEKKISSTPFDSPIKWTYFELWHHQGRRARMGASMMGNDYVQWHGFYEVGKIFYNDFLPESEKLLPGVTTNIKAMPANQWLQGLTPEQREQIRKFYQGRYQQTPAQ